MRTRRAVVGLLAGSLVFTSLAVLPAAVASAGASNATTAAPVLPQPANGTSVAVCGGKVAPGHVACLALRRTDSAATNASPARPGNAPAVSASDTSPGDGGAYAPANLQAAYNLPSSTNGAGQTVAVVDAYDDPTAESDLAAYRSYFGLSPCTTANGCFRKVNEQGGTSYPQGDTGWGEEISLDLDMVSAICPNCDILLVEASSTDTTDLGIGVNEAVSLGANVVSNSYGGPEFNGEATQSTQYFSHPGVAITVAAGDEGYGAEFPSTSNTVTSVGGTTLEQATGATSRDATETAWSDGGSGCSSYESKPTWQSDTGCTKRMTADVSAEADPDTGVWVYDTYGGGQAWGVYGGTSVAAPIIGGVYALADNAPSTTKMNSLPYAHTVALNDVTSGSDGTCSVAYFCHAEVGYDGPTGLGTPNGVAAFTAGQGSAASPSAPTNFAVSAANGAVDLSWSAPSSTGGSAITGYKVYRGLSSGTESLLTTLGVTTSYTDTAVTNGTTYYYEITAVNGVGESPMSAQQSAALVTPKVAGKPTGLAAHSSGSPTVTLSWSAPASDGGASITGYSVLRGTKSGHEASIATAACTASSCSYSDTGTSKGTTYYYEVAAINSVGTGANSSQVSVKAK
jgi:subtilase family serine protease